MSKKVSSSDNLRLVIDESIIKKSPKINDKFLSRLYSVKKIIKKSRGANYKLGSKVRKITL